MVVAHRNLKLDTLMVLSPESLRVLSKPLPPSQEFDALNSQEKRVLEVLDKALSSDATAQRMHSLVRPCVKPVVRLTEMQPMVVT